MTIAQQIITIALCAGATVFSRALPFVVFGGKRQTPKYVKYLGKTLPTAVFAMLVIYCLKDVEFFSSSNHGIPEIIAIAVTVVIHLWKRNMLFSIIAGTVLYMILVQLVFV